MENYSKSIRIIATLTLLACWLWPSSAQAGGGDFLEEWRVAPSISKEVTAGSTESDEFIGEMGPWQAEASTMEWCGETTATASYSIDPGAVSILAKVFRLNERARSEIIHFPLASPITVSAEHPAFLEVDFDSATIDVFQNVYSGGMYYWVWGGAVVKIELRDSRESLWSGIRLLLSRWRGTTSWGDIGSRWEWRPEQVVAGSPLNLVDYLAPGRVLTIDTVSVYAEVYCYYAYRDRWKDTLTLVPTPDSWQFEATAELNNLRSIRIFKPVVAPSVSTLPATDVTKTSATLNGILTDDGGEACQYRFRYREEKGDYLSPWSGSATSGESFSQAISGLSPNATYYFNAQAKNSAGESAWGNEQSFVADSLDFEIVSARMVSPNELGIDIKVRFPKGFPKESPRKVDFWANVNGTDVRETCDISSFVGPGETANIQCVINFESEGVPRFQDHVAFRLYGAAYWEEGQYSYVYSIPVEIPLPVIIIHGYVYTHTAGGWFLDKVKILAYFELMDFLAKNGYTTDPSWYRTMWGPTDCQYEADKVSEQRIYSVVDFWVQRALEKEDGSPRTYADKVDIIGHSTGGLVARYYAGGASTVNKVISIGTPHLGLTPFYQYAFDYSTKEQADKLFRVNPRDPASEENLLRWFEPEYGESSLVDAWGVPVAEPYENNFDAAYNPNVDYLSIYANHRTDTPYKLVVNRTKKGWYEILDVLGGNGDGTVPELSGSGFSPDDLGPITSGVHQFLCEEPEVQKRVLNFLSGR